MNSRRTVKSNRLTRLAIVCVILLLTARFEALAQSVASDTATVQQNAAKAWADYAVPDMPAFAVLGLDPTSILRPTSAREVGVAVANFLANGQVLPKAFAAELAPYMLLANKSLSDYQQNRFWYRMRLSVGTKAGADGGTDLGLGLRITLWDETDLRVDTNLQNKLVMFAHNREGVRSECTKKIPIALLRADPVAYGKRLEELVRDSLLAQLEQTGGTDSTLGIDATISVEREKAKQTKWNKQIVELGIAGMASSPDSSAKNLFAVRYALWLTGAVPIFRSDGQLIGSLRVAIARDAANSLKTGEGALAFRGYVGRNSQKGFLGVDWNVKDGMNPSFGINLGGELNLSNGIWLDLTIGLQKPSNADAKIASSLNVRLGTPELKL